MWAAVISALVLTALFWGVARYQRETILARTIKQARLLALVFRENMQDNILQQDYQRLEELLSALEHGGHCVNYYFYDRDDVCYFSNVEAADVERMGDPISRRGKASGKDMYTEPFRSAAGRDLLATVFPVTIGGRSHGTLRFDFPLRDPSMGWLTAMLFGCAGTLVFLFVAWFAASVQNRRVLAEIGPVLAHVEALEQGDYRRTITGGDVSKPMAKLVTALGRLTDALRAKEKIHRYISKSTLYRIHQETGTDPELAGEKKIVTVLFTDLADFTAATEHFAPHETLRLLNGYMDLIVRVILKNGGVVERFIGDSILSVFYAKEPADAAHKATIAAFEMVGDVHRFNERRRKDHREALDVRIGLDTGEVITGNIGSEDRVDYAVIGTAVRAAASIEKAAARGTHTKILVSERTRALVEDLVETVAIEGVTLAGAAEACTLFELTAIKDVDRLVAELEAGDAEVAMKILDVLGASRDPSVAPTLRKYLGHDDAGVRGCAVRALGRLADVEGGADIPDLLARSLRGEPSPRVRSMIVSELADVGQPHHLDSLRDCLRDSNPRVRANAVQTLDKIRGGRDVREWIEPLLHDTNNRVKANAGIFLWKLGDASVLNVLRQMLFDGSEDVRASAIYAIGEIGALEEIERHLDDETLHDRAKVPRLVRALRSAVDNIIEALDDASSKVRYQAVTALGKLGDRKAVPALLACLHRSDSAMLERMGEALEKMGVSRTVVRLVKVYRPAGERPPGD